ncbi:hypothetical protein Sru01_34710 [Sphaerisporangium rufum]|uniref:Uncharacterized protein n=1 Tax=Sphaerisporangium rufum TaxID=1381558 RepID=A0A919R2G3_9ACTN|nr:hypothetical protein Sru01_34710 [Sphaerisporangium rufum]
MNLPCVNRPVNAGRRPGRPANPAAGVHGARADPAGYTFDLDEAENGKGTGDSHAGGDEAAARGVAMLALGMIMKTFGLVGTVALLLILLAGITVGTLVWRRRG